MPSQRKRIGFLPSEEVHLIIDKLCKASEFSQSKVTGLLVEEALRTRGVLKDSISLKESDIDILLNDSDEYKSLSESNKSSYNDEFFKVNSKSLTNNIKMMHEYIEYKYFKKVMKQNNNIL